MELWDLYGLRANPYRFTELEPVPFDEALYESRGDAEGQFASSVTDESGGMLVISGELGTGKTSFANILQHRMLLGDAGFGLRPLPSYFPIQLTKSDNAISVARKVVENAIRSIEKYCALFPESKVPSETKRFADWLFGGAVGQLSIAGTGRTVSPVNAGTVEACAKLLSTIANECKQDFGVSGLFVCIDNTETVGAAQLTDLLKELRDSLLSLPFVWWIIIGPKDLYSQIQQHNRSVSQRIVGQGIELEPLTGSEFHDLIQKRVRAYGARADAVAPLSTQVHQRLHAASDGQLRFALKLGHDVLVDLNAQMYEHVKREYATKGRKPQPAAILSGVRSLLKERMSGVKCFHDTHSDAVIAKICEKALRPLGIPVDVAAALQRLGTKPFSIECLLQLNVPPEYANDQFLSQLEAAEALRRANGDGRDLWVVKRHAYLLSDMGKLAAS